MESDIIPLKNGGECEMSDWTTLKCAKCQGGDIWLMCKGKAIVTGILKCGDPKCNNEHPFTMVNNTLQEFLPNLPIEVSQKLKATIPEDIIADIKEAERSEYLQCHKAAATMCRRALQIGLIDKGIPDKPLTSMIEDAKTQDLLDDKTYILAKSIKGFGDIGAHRKEVLERGGYTNADSSNSQDVE
ncbi:DUF4145 domain-containing protein [Chloroflexota bacterium]